MICVRSRLAGVFACCALGFAGAAAPAGAANTPATERRYVAIVPDSTTVGRMLVRSEGSSKHRIEWSVSENGRGPRLTTDVVLDASRRPKLQRVVGYSLARAPIDERYSFARRRAAWKSLNDAGSAASDAVPLYVVTDQTPWDLALYTRLAARAPGGRVATLPGGELHVERLGGVRVGAAERAREVDAYALWGLSPEPRIVLLEADGSLYSVASSRTVVLPEEDAGDAARLFAERQRLEAEYAARISASLRHRFHGPVYLRNVRVFDSERATLGSATTVVVFDGRVVRVDASADPPPDAVVIDGAGGTLVPGLHDMHVHLSSPWAALLHLAAGVTTVRDQGNDNASLLRTIADIESGRILGPTIDPSGLVEGASPFSTRLGFVVDDVAHALEKVRWYADHGYRRIKIYNSFRPEWTAAVAAEAHRLGMQVVGHVPAFSASDAVVRDGYDEITHLNQLLLRFVLEPGDDPRSLLRVTAIGDRLGSVDLRGPGVRGQLDLMRERGVALDTTAAVFKHFMLSRPGHASPADAGWLGHMPLTLQRERMRPFFGVAGARRADWSAAWEKLRETVLLAHDTGITLLPGTDDVPGFMMHTELESYVEAGISAGRALQIATLGSARYLGTDQKVGSITPGKIADLMLVDGDPTADIGALRRVRMVLKRGDVLFPAEIHAQLGIRPFAAPPVVNAPRGSSVPRHGPDAVR